MSPLKNISVLSRKFRQDYRRVHPSLFIQFLDWENNGENDWMPLGLWLCFATARGYAEIFLKLEQS